MFKWILILILILISSMESMSVFVCVSVVEETTITMTGRRNLRGFLKTVRFWMAEVKDDDGGSFIHLECEGMR